MRQKKIRSITIIGRRWFEKTNGNTYFSAIGLINGEVVVSIDFSYGYGSQYESEIIRKMKDAKLLPGIEEYASGGSQSGWSYCDKNSIAYYSTVSDVAKRKDLAF